VSTTTSTALAGRTTEKASAFDNLARAIVHLPPIVWLITSGIGMTGIYWFAFASRYSLTQYGRFSQQSIATLNYFSAEGAFLFVFSFIALFALYVFAIRFGLGLKTLNRRAAWIVIGVFALIMNFVLLPMDIFDAVDVFDYIIRGRMSAVYGLNPLSDTPNQVAGDPFYAYAAWHTVPSAYGPAWEAIANVTSRIAGDDFNTNIILFKLTSLIGYIITALAVVLILREIAPKRALLGFLIFAWNPLVVYMTGGGGHNDTLMTAGMLLGIYFLVKRWYVAGIAAALFGALIKFIPILLIPLIVIVALRDLSTRLRIRFLVLSAVVGGALILAFYGPYWTGIDTLGISRRTTMYTGSIATLVRQTIAIPLDGHTGEAADTPAANNVIKYAIIGLMGLFCLSEFWEVYEKRDPMRPIHALTRILMFYLLVTCIWFQSWYVLWVIPLAAVLENAPMRRYVLWFSYLVTWESFLYNYVTLRPSGWAPLPWRDLVPVAAFQGVAWLAFASYWMVVWLRRGARTPFNVRVGEKLSQARIAAGLSITELADELGWSNDALSGYEAGERSLPLDRAQVLGERLGVSLPVLLGEAG
jgi:alpha-1,6-mannosyltransferase